MCNGKEYYINGWASANYWHLTDQIPSVYDVYTPNKQGTKIILNTRITFHRIRKIDASKVTTKKIAEHTFIILNKNNSAKWIKSKE
jgi:hypothetical protein